MQIHELNAGTPAAADSIPMDNGSDTYKTTADKLIPTFTSGDSLTPTGWTDVAKLTTGSTLATLFGAISTMIKNVRYLFAKLGTTDISSIGGGTVTGALDTYVKDSGWKDVTFASKFTNYGATNNLRYRKIGKIGILTGVVTPTETITASTVEDICTLPSGYRPAQAVYLIMHGTVRNKWLLTINTSGLVTFARYGGYDSYTDAAAGTWCPIHAVFFID